MNTALKLARPHCFWFVKLRLSSTSARSLAVTRGSFLASAHRELIVALVQSQGYAYRSCALLLAKASGRPLLTQRIACQLSSNGHACNTKLRKTLITPKPHSTSRFSRGIHQTMPNLADCRQCWREPSVALPQKRTILKLSCAVQ
jgi:hypothetical protein